MKITWEVDEKTTVEADLGAFGRKVINVNGTEVQRLRSLRSKSEIPFDLSGGRHATLSVMPEFVGRPQVDLRVDGRLTIPTGKDPIKCRSCGTVVKPYDRFCPSCGHAMPSGEDHQNLRRVGEAAGVIKALAVLFTIFGAIMFLVTKGQAAAVLAKLEGMDAATMLDTPINGTTYTVGALREQLLWEPWGVLIVNIVLAAVMAGLAMWGKRAPLAAVLVATATYVVVLVANAIIDPTTIGQGIIMKIIIIALLVKGIKAALALRTANV